jgi:serine/threonine protein kinase
LQVLKIPNDPCSYHRYIFQELLTGGDLFSYFTSRDFKILAAEAGIIIFQVLKGLEYLHDKGIVHRDLKLENILMSAPEPRARIVLADFGSSRNLPRAKSGSLSTIKRMFTKVGTIDYQAP